MASLELKSDSTNKISIGLNANDGDILTGGGDAQQAELVFAGYSNPDGKVRVRNRNNTVVASLTAGTVGGLLSLANADGHAVVVLNADTGQIWAGGGQKDGSGGKQGTLVLYDANDKNVVVLNAASAGIALGGGGKQGNLRLQDDSGDIVTLSAGGDNLAVDEGGKRVFAFNRGAFGNTGNARAGLFLGIHATEGPPFKPGVMELRGDNGLASIFLDGSQGDIVLANGDCAEEFAVSEARHIDPGTVVVLSEHDEVRESSKAYDRRAVGVVSGAGDLRPAIVLDRTASQANRVPVALLGKVYCKIDARDSSIDVGDLLTTSDTPGHAMKASDPTRSFGAVIGKALRPLSGGTGLIPVLIALQ